MLSSRTQPPLTPTDLEFATDGSTSASYYPSYTFGKVFSPIAVVTTAAMHLALLSLKFLFPSHPHRLSPEPLLPEDCTRPISTSFSTTVPLAENNSLNSSRDGCMRGVAIVTGANTGVGFETSLSLVRRGYDVVLACRSRDKGEEAVRRINFLLDSDGLAEHSSEIAKSGKAIFLQPMDLSDLSSVHAFAASFTNDSRFEVLNILVNNAGINYRGTSDDGFELCFQTNFLGHFLLTQLLLPHLLRAKNELHRGGKSWYEAGRVVNLSSVMHHFTRADEKRQGHAGLIGRHDEEFWRGSATPGVSSNTYAESKLAAILFTLELNRRFSGEGLRSVAVNPGSVNSDIWRRYSKVMRFLFSLIYIDAKQGSRTSEVASVGNLPRDVVYLQPYWLPPFFSEPTSASASVQNLDQHSEIEAEKIRPRISSSFRRRYDVAWPAFEMLGPYVGYSVAKPRLPNDGKEGRASAAALWTVCEDLLSKYLT